MLQAFVEFLILLVVIVLVAGLVLWAIEKFMPAIHPPAKMVVGALALIAILLALYRLVGSVNLGL